MIMKSSSQALEGGLTLERCAAQCECISLPPALLLLSSLPGKAGRVTEGNSAASSPKLVGQNTRMPQAEASLRLSPCAW